MSTRVSSTNQTGGTPQLERTECTALVFAGTCSMTYVIEKDICICSGSTVPAGASDVESTAAQQRRRQQQQHLELQQTQPQQKQPQQEQQRDKQQNHAQQHHKQQPHKPQQRAVTREQRQRAQVAGDERRRLEAHLADGEEESLQWLMQDQRQLTKECRAAVLRDEAEALQMWPLCCSRRAKTLASTTGCAGHEAGELLEGRGWDWDHAALRLLDAGMGRGNRPFQARPGRWQNEPVSQQLVHQREQHMITTNNERMVSACFSDAMLEAGL